MGALGLFSGAAARRRGIGYHKFGKFKNFQSPDFLAQYPNSANDRDKLNLEQIKSFKSPSNEENVQITHELHQSSIKKRIKPLAHVDVSKCTGCGDCESRCPFNAIIVDVVAYVNEDICTGCGICASFCPVDAITINY